MAKAQWQKQRQEEGRRQNNERKKDLELTFRMLDWQRREVKKAQEGSLAGSKKRKLEDEDDTPAQMPYYKGVCQIDLDVGQMYRTKEYVQEQEKRQFDEATQGRVQIPGLDPRNVMPSLPSIPTSLIDPLLLEQQPQEASSSTLQSYSPIDPRLLQPTPGTKKRKRDDDETSSTPSCKKQRAAPLSDQETCRIV
ncbi:hypothetical protein CC80DRAFT_490217 [Byssothecium circinans]|uniref:Uncharacterized protein n=1 Tax=Byssothecium circinans TaxID=147558 RepID=A0A6A5U2W2_9PLEO|nr:hypothetical protein CC80DRAFT_490217 [Byssothecium circinans]